MIKSSLHVSTSPLIPFYESNIRLAAMRCLLRGMGRQDVSETFCRSDRMVRLWIIKYNHGGIDALISSKPKVSHPGKHLRRSVV